MTDYDGARSSCRLRASAWPRHGVVVLSFDDRNFGTWRKAFPLFEKYDATVTFLACGGIGRGEIGFARAAMALGHDFGLHGAGHRNADSAIAEMGAEAYWKAEMEPQLAPLAAANIFPRSFGYPNSRRNSETDALFLSKGFARLRGKPDGFVSPNPFGRKTDRWRRVSETDAVFAPAADFLKTRLIGSVVIGKAYNTDMEDILAALRRCGDRAEFLSLVSHAIAPGADGIDMPTEWLEQILSSAADAGVVVHGMR